MCVYESVCMCVCPDASMPLSLLHVQLNYTACLWIIRVFKCMCVSVFAGVRVCVCALAFIYMRLCVFAGMRVNVCLKEKKAEG